MLLENFSNNLIEFQITPDWIINLEQPYKVYQLYLALKLHFAPGKKYDFFVQRGAIANSRRTFEGRRDRIFFQRIRKRFPFAKDVYCYFLANLSRNSQWWVGEQEIGVDNYNCWNARLNNIQSVVSSDISLLGQELYNSDVGSFLRAITVTPESPTPLFIQMVLGERISLETASILANGLPVVSLWEQTQPELVKHDLILKPLVRQLTQYGKFFNVPQHMKDHAFEVKELLSTNRAEWTKSAGQ